MTIFKIYKYPLKMEWYQSVEVDGAVRVLSIVKQGLFPVMYVLVDPEKETTNRKSVFEIKMVCTGHMIRGDKDTTNDDIFTYEFMSTLGFDGDHRMFHFFVRRKFIE